MSKIRTYGEVKEKYLEFVGNYLADVEGTEKKELMPTLWSVTNEEKNIIATVQCQMRIVDQETGEEEWFAVVNNNGQRKAYLLEFTEESKPRNSHLTIFKDQLAAMPNLDLVNVWGHFVKIPERNAEEKFKESLAKMEILKRMRN
jgi:hypothetical protein